MIKKKELNLYKNLSMSKKKKIGAAVLIILIAIQWIRPSKNTNTNELEDDITVSMQVPKEIVTVLKTSCYDCHSNNTNDMWYMNVQPIGWWIKHHINEAKEELNFSEFANYSLKRKAHKMEEIADEVKENEMPLSSYTLMHGNAKLSSEQRKLLVDWAMNEYKVLKENNNEEERN